MSSTLSVNNKQINSNDLRLLQKLYRSREFKQTQVVSLTASKSYTVIVYGSINALSSNQRRAFRNHLMQTKGVAMKLTLFSSTVAENLLGYSSLQHLETLFKGTTYQRVITVSSASEYDAYVKVVNTFNHLKTLKFSEILSFNFNPAVIFPSITSNNTLVTPRRYTYFENKVLSYTSTKSHPITILLNTIHGVSSNII